ncbi:methyl-accepting chemotaxis protein [Natrialbaceae archaeon GCM10025810]|uniref:methyl-accepting chemotaxis protein n=1 Tax=Halovalidus salilacus TaxID=3075124 RepID=UPI0036212ADF
MALEEALPDGLRRTYSVKIGLLFVAVVVMTVAVAGLFFGHVSGEVGPAAEERFSDGVTDRSEVADRWLETNAETAAGLASDATVRDGNPDEIDDRLAEARTDREDRVAEIHYLDGDGDVLASSGDEAEGENLFDAAEVDGATDGPTAPHDGLSADRSVLTFVEPVPADSAGSDGERYVAVSVPTDALASVLESDADDRRTIVTDASGERILSTGEEGDDGDDAILEALSPDAGEVVTGTPADSDIEYAATAATIGDGESAMTVTTYGLESDVYGPLNAATSGLAALLFVFVIQLGLVWIVIGGNLSLKLRQLAGKAERMGEGDLEVGFETGRIDEVGTLYDSFASMRDSLSQTLSELEDERERARAAQRETERRNRELEAEAERFGEVMAACADGDLERRLEPESDHEAMVAIAEAFNEMVADLERAVTQVKRVSAEVAAMSTEFQSSSAEIRRASEAVSGSIQEISDGSSTQAEDLETATAEVNELSATVEEVAAATSTIADQSAAVDTLATDGRRAAAETTEEMREASDRTESAAETIRALDEEAERIQEIVELIDEIAGQTNMLALNAAIESARSESATSEGGGFQAVADEVKELAAETQDAVEDVERMIESIQRRATESATRIEETEVAIGSAADRVASLSETLDRIARGIEQVDAGVQEIDDATDEQANSAEELTTIVRDVASVASETTSQAQRVAAAAEETTATITDVSNEAIRLDRRATALAAAVDEFSVSADLETGPTAAPIDGGESR